MFTRPFYFYVVTRVCFGLLATILSVSIGWHLYQATANPFDLALVGVLRITPMILLFLVTGWIADNCRKKWILLACAAVMFGVYSALALVMYDGVFSKYTLFVFVFVSGAAQSFVSPALVSFLPKVVSNDQLSRAVAVTSVVSNVVSTVGPFAGGVLIAVLDFNGYWVLAAMALCALISTLFLPNIAVDAMSNRGLSQVLEGIRFVWQNPLVLPGISLDLLLVMAGSVVALMPIFASDILEVGPEGLGLLRAMPAIGAVMAGTLLARRSDLRHSGRRLFLALLVFSASIFVFGLSTNFWISLAALWVYGASDMVSVNIRTTLLQLATPAALRGRVNAVSGLFIAASNDLGSFRSGSMAALIGAAPAVILGAAMAFAVVVGGYVLSPTLRRLDRLTDAEYRPEK